MDGARMLRLGALALALVGLGAGCQRPAGLQPVQGRVTYRGTTLTNGVVVFTPDTSRGESGPIALGTIHDDGSYTLSTGDHAGAQAGWYRVTVAALATPASSLPEKYRDPEYSLLRCEVKANQANRLDFNLD